MKPTRFFWQVFIYASLAPPSPTRSMMALWPMKPPSARRCLPTPHTPPLRPLIVHISVPSTGEIDVFRSVPYRQRPASRRSESRAPRPRRHAAPRSPPQGTTSLFFRISFTRGMESSAGICTS